jgi:hypothetical protein
MENYKINQVLLSNLSILAGNSASACQQLEYVLTKGAAKIKRKSELEMLEKLATRIEGELEEANGVEQRARDAFQRSESISEAGKLFTLVINRPDWEKVIEARVAARRSQKPQTFGRTMVCVGTGGLPDDVSVVPVSKLARMQNRKESEILDEFRNQGKVLVSPSVFHNMLELLSKNINEGKLSLPVQPEGLLATW